VIYTSRKYVRKPKGAVAGEVIVERENVILVAPDAGSFSNSNFK
jgi:predicted ribosome quality control (RQC) complex YloA/Tae2 family protein